MVEPKNLNPGSGTVKPGPFSLLFLPFIKLHLFFSLSCELCEKCFLRYPSFPYSIFRGEIYLLATIIPLFCFIFLIKDSFWLTVLGHSVLSPPHPYSPCFSVLGISIAIPSSSVIFFFLICFQSANKLIIHFCQCL